MKTAFASFAAIGLLLCSPNFFSFPVLADEPPAPVPSPPWSDAESRTLTDTLAPCQCEPECSLRVIPFGWLPEMHGVLTLRGEPARVDVSTRRFFKLVDDLDWLSSAQIEGRVRNWGLLFSGLYMKLSPENSVRRVDFSTSFEQITMDLVVTYEVEGLTDIFGLSPGSRFELLGGTRYNYLEGGLTLTGPRGRSGSVDGSEEWFDPIFGTRLTVPLNDRAILQTRADIGGFNWGDSARLTWNIELMMEYRLSCRCALWAGYRWLSVDYSSGSGDNEFGYDFKVRGPVLGLVLEF